MSFSMNSLLLVFYYHSKPSIHLLFCMEKGDNTMGGQFLSDICLWLILFIVPFVPMCIGKFSDNYRNSYTDLFLMF